MSVVVECYINTASYGEMILKSIGYDVMAAWTKYKSWNQQ